MKTASKQLLGKKIIFTLRCRKLYLVNIYLILYLVEKGNTAPIFFKNVKVSIL